MTLDLIRKVDAVDDKVDNYGAVIRRAHSTVFQGLRESGEPPLNISI